MALGTPLPHDFVAMLANVNEQLVKDGHHSGLPLGIGIEEDIQTNCEIVAALSTLVYDKFHHEEEPGEESAEPVVEMVESEASVADFERTEEVVAEWKATNYWTMAWIGKSKFVGTTGAVQKYRGQTVVTEKNTETGKYRFRILEEKLPTEMRLLHQLRTITKRNRYTPLETELRAQSELFRHLSEEQQASYQLTGAIEEIGKSGVAYIIRKDRPTLAYRPDPGTGYNGRLLAVLCLHPQAYYLQSWTGSMATSDEVLTHLLYIRSDERKFWSKANQMRVDAPQSGV